MKLFLFGVVALIVAIGSLCYASKKCKHGMYPKQKAISLVIAAICFLVGVGGIATDCIATIPTGHTGIVTTFGRVEEYTFEAGVHAKAPWQQVVKM